MSDKPRLAEIEIHNLVEFLGLGAPAKITFVRTGKFMLTVDEIPEGIRVIYSDKFIEKLRKNSANPMNSQG